MQKKQMSAEVVETREDGGCSRIGRRCCKGLWTR